jgi:hypothetical protein
MTSPAPRQHAQSGPPDVARKVPAQPAPAVQAGHDFSRVPDIAERALPAILVAVAVFIDLLLYGLVVPIVPGYARSLGAGTGLLGIVFAAYAAGSSRAPGRCWLDARRAAPCWPCSAPRRRSAWPSRSCRCGSTTT